MVFIIQNTQNSDTIAIHLKLDELLRAAKNTHNPLLKVEELPDKELEEMHKCYEELASQIKKRMQKGQTDTGVVDIDKNAN